MTITQFYEKAGGEYSAVLNRLGSEAMIKRFVLKFPKDPGFAELAKGFSDRDAERAFRAAHTMKGICANLGFDSLFHSVSALTESLRERSFSEEADQLFCKTAEEYRILIANIQEIK